MSITSKRVICLPQFMIQNPTALNMSKISPSSPVGVFHGGSVDEDHP